MPLEMIAEWTTTSNDYYRNALEEWRVQESFVRNRAGEVVAKEFVFDQKEKWRHLSLSAMSHFDARIDD